jgi:carboxymethylenebutenolidase
MAAMEIRSEWVKVPNADLQIDSYLAQPTESGTYPGIIVLQEVFGVNAHIREVTEKIAREGYVAIAPALYQRTAGGGFETGYSDEDLELGRKYKNMTKASELLSDVQAAIDYIKGQNNVKSSGFGCIGFCFGGHVAYLAATLNDIQATASFYGAGIASMTPGGGEPTINRTPEINGTVYAFFGMEDPLISPEEVDQVEAALQKHQVPHKVFRYQGASHGFCCDHRQSYHEQAATDAWKHVLEELFPQLK